MEPKPPVSYADFAKLELRIAKVIAAREHPNADKLLLLQIQVGDVEKQIVAGIPGHYQTPSPVGPHGVGGKNLQPATISRRESNRLPPAPPDSGRARLRRPPPPSATGPRA